MHPDSINAIILDNIQEKRIENFRITLAKLLLFARGNDVVLEMIHSTLDEDDHLSIEFHKTLDNQDV